MTLAQIVALIDAQIQDHKAYRAKALSNGYCSQGAAYRVAELESSNAESRIRI